MHCLHATTLPSLARRRPTDASFRSSAQSPPLQPARSSPHPGLRRPTVAKATYGHGLGLSQTVLSLHSSAARIQRVSSAGPIEDRDAEVGSCPKMASYCGRGARARVHAACRSGHAIRYLIYVDVHMALSSVSEQVMGRDDLDGYTRWDTQVPHMGVAGWWATCRPMATR
jgi:hypothetical protein